MKSYLVHFIPEIGFQSFYFLPLSRLLYGGQNVSHNGLLYNISLHKTFIQHNGFQTLSDSSGSFCPDSHPSVVSCPHVTQTSPGEIIVQGLLLAQIGRTKVIFFQLTYQPVERSSLFHLGGYEAGLLANMSPATWREASCRKKPVKDRAGRWMGGGIQFLQFFFHLMNYANGILSYMSYEFLS